MTEQTDQLMKDADQMVDSGDFEFSLETVFEVDDDTWLDMMVNETTSCMWVPIVGGLIGATAYYYTVELIFPMVQVQEVAIEELDTTAVQRVPFALLAANVTQMKRELVGLQEEE